MTTLIFVRHGESTSNRATTFTGQTDAPLTETGELQAHRAAEALKNRKIDLVLASDLCRATRTGEIIAQAVGAPLEKDKRFREIYGGKWQSMTFDDIARFYPDRYAAWKHDIDTVACPDGESMADVRRRIVSAAKDVAETYDGKTVIIATHACPIRALKSTVLNVPMQSFSWCANASYTVFTYQNGTFTLTEDNVCDYMQDIETNLSNKI